MPGRSRRRHSRWLRTTLPLALVAGCLTEPDGVASVEVQPESLTFAGIRAPAQTVTVTVTGRDGRTHDDIPVTWRFWVGSVELVESSPVVRFEHVGGRTWRAIPAGVPGGAILYAEAGRERSGPISVWVAPGPAMALEIEAPQPTSVQRGLPFTVFVRTVDADRFGTPWEGPITAAIASGDGTLSGPTTRPAGGYSTIFEGLRIDGVGVFTLRLSSPGLIPAVTGPILVTPPPA